MKTRSIEIRVEADSYTEEFIFMSKYAEIKKALMSVLKDLKQVKSVEMDPEHNYRFHVQLELGDSEESSEPLDPSKIWPDPKK